MIWAAILKFFGGLTPKRLLYIGVAFVLAIAVWKGVDFVNDKIEAERQVVVLQQEIADQEEAIRLLRKQAEQKASAQKAADAARAGLEVVEDALEAIRRGIAASPEEDDGEVAPVLRRVIDSLP